MNFTREELTGIVYSDNKRYVVKQSVEYDEHRWYTVYQCIFHDTEEDVYYMTYYNRDNGEMGDVNAYEEWDEPICVKVEVAEVTATVYMNGSEVIYMI